MTTTTIKHREEVLSSINQSEWSGLPQEVKERLDYIKDFITNPTSEHAPTDRLTDVWGVVATLQEQESQTETDILAVNTLMTWLGGELFKLVADSKKQGKPTDGNAFEKTIEEIKTTSEEQKPTDGSFPEFKEEHERAIKLGDNFWSDYEYRLSINAVPFFLNLLSRFIYFDKAHQIDVANWKLRERKIEGGRLEEEYEQGQVMVYDFFDNMTNGGVVDVIRDWFNRKYETEEVEQFLVMSVTKGNEMVTLPTNIDVSVTKLTFNVLVKLKKANEEESE